MTNESMTAIPQGDLEAETIEQCKTELPKLYKIILHNDDVTPFIFVVLLLLEVFDAQEDEAMEITQEVHEQGKGIAGVFTYEMAEQKLEEANQMINENGFALVLTIEEDTV